MRKRGFFKYLKEHAPVFFLAGVLLAGGAGCASTASVQRERSADAHYKLGLLHLNNNQTQQAFVEFQKSIEANPRHRDSHYSLGHIYFQQGRWDLAEKEFKETLRADREFSEAYNYLGRVYAEKGDWKSAVAEYRKALKNPKFSTPQFAHYNLGIAFMNMKDYPAALKEFDEALRIGVSSGAADIRSAAYLAKGQIYTQLSKQSEATEALKQAVRIDPNNALIYYNLGKAYLNERLLKQAKEAFEKAIQLAPGGELAKESKVYLDRLR